MNDLYLNKHEIIEELIDAELDDRTDSQIQSEEDFVKQRKLFWGRQSFKDLKLAYTLLISK